MQQSTATAIPGFQGIQIYYRISFDSSRMQYILLLTYVGYEKHRIDAVKLCMYKQGSGMGRIKPGIKIQCIV